MEIKKFLSAVGKPGNGRMSLSVCPPYLYALSSKQAVLYNHDIIVLQRWEDENVANN